MNRTIYYRLRFIAVICIFILVVELVYVAYSLTYKRSRSMYFEGINIVEIYGSDYITVGSNNNNENHYEKATISRFNSKKEKTFERLYNPGYNGVFFDVVVDGDNYVAVGSYEKTKSEHHNSIRRALIVKYDSEGEILFDKDFEILDNSRFTSITKDGDDYLVTGQSIYKNTRVGHKDGGAILARYSKDGKLLWSKTYGSSKGAIFNDLLVVDDSIYAIGTDDNSHGIIVKYDMDGNYIDYNDFKLTDSLGFSGIANIGRSVYVSGAIKAGNTDTDAIIVEYDLDCDYVNQVTYKGNGRERFNRLMVDNYNNLVVIGTQAKVRKKSKKNYGEYNYDGIIAKYDENLKNIDAVLYGDERDDYFTDVKYTNGNYLVVGYSSYEDGSYMSKFINYSKALKVLEVG